MSRKMNSLLAAMIPLILMGNESRLLENNSNYLKPQDVDVSPKEKPIPKGCQRYYYNREGVCCKSESEVYFDALKPSSARKKFERWRSNLNAVV